MSTTSMLTGNDLTRKLWSKQGWVQAMQKAALGHGFNRGAVYFPEELMGMRARGDRVTFNYTGKLTAVPIGEGGVLVGNAEALDLGFHQMSMNITRIGVENPNDETIEQFRTLVPFEERARKLIPNRAVELLDTAFFYHLAGASPTTLTINGTTYSTAAELLHVQGHNTPVAPSSDRILRAGAVANDQSLGSSDTLRLDHIDYALELNDRNDQPIEPYDDGTFDFYCSPEQMVDLMHDASGKIQWFNIELAKITGSKSNEIENRFKNGMVCAGKYRNVYLYEAGRVAYGANSSTSAVITTVRRAVLVGKDALSFASPFGGRVTDTDVPLRFFEQLSDHGYYKSVEGRLVYGMKKMQPSNGSDIGVIVISTYAAAHT